MDFAVKLQAVRKNSGLSQEELAERIGVSRQAVAKWEAGLTYPDIGNLIALSDVLRISLDRLLREDSDTCVTELTASVHCDHVKTVAFLCKAKKLTYAAHGAEEAVPFRPCSHDLKYEEGKYLYLDTYLGGEKYAGEEGVWYQGAPVWVMNYVGRILCEPFSGDFLKEALLRVPEDHPYRGPMVYSNGDYRYHSTVSGGFEWFQGYEEIFCKETKVYECRFHGGCLK